MSRVTMDNEIRRADLWDMLRDIRNIPSHRLYASLDDLVLIDNFPTFIEPLRTVCVTPDDITFTAPARMVIFGEERVEKVDWQREGF